ncbi:MAG: hypothetical protein ACK4TG_09595 [Thermaurantiacus sp.]
MFLSILAEAYAGGELPANRSDLFRMLIWRLMREEHARHRGVLVPPLISNFDQLRLSKPETQGSGTHGLPNDGIFIESLQKLAWGLQTSPDRRLRLPIEQARRILGDFGGDILSVGCALSLLTLDLDRSEVGFEHHLLQEFFVALSLASEGIQEIVEDRLRTGLVEIVDGRPILRLPLRGGNREQLLAHMAAHALPPHPLVAAGYPSIGCGPCTSPVRPGEDPRAGRWRGWEKTECGIHVGGGDSQPAF